MSGPGGASSGLARYLPALEWLSGRPFILFG